MTSIIYIGYSETALMYLLRSGFFRVIMAIGVNGRISRNQYELIKEYHIPYVELSNSEDLRNIRFPSVNDFVILMHKFEFIIPLDMIQKYRIFNIHSGNLRLNRGAHPIVRSILNMDQETYLSIYELVGLGIDEGNLIDEYRVEIDKKDDTLTLDNKLNQGIPSLLISLSEFLAGKRQGRLVVGGRYYPKICEADYTIDLQNDTIDVICAKIRSQRAYNGAILFLDKKKYRIKKYNIKKEEIGNPHRIMLANEDVIIMEGEIKMICPIEQEI